MADRKNQSEWCTPRKQDTLNSRTDPLTNSQIVAASTGLEKWAQASIPKDESEIPVSPMESHWG